MPLARRRDREGPARLRPARDPRRGARPGRAGRIGRHRRRSSRKELPAIHAAGIARSEGEPIPGSVTIAVPVIREDGIVAAIGIIGPESRCGLAWRARVSRLLPDAAAAIVGVARAGCAGRVRAGPLVCRHWYLSLFDNRPGTPMLRTRWTPFDRLAPIDDAYAISAGRGGLRLADDRREPCRPGASGTSSPSDRSAERMPTRRGCASSTSAPTRGGVAHPGSSTTSRVRPPPTAAACRSASGTAAADARAAAGRPAHREAVTAHRRDVRATTRSNSCASAPAGRRLHARASSRTTRTPRWIDAAAASRRPRTSSHRPPPDHRVGR